jgi:hypothetical protein
MLERILTTPTKQLEIPTAIGPLPEFLDPSVLGGLDPHEDWLTWPGVSVPPAPLLMGAEDVRRDRLSVALVAAAVYALRTVTRNGENMDFDPDDLIAYLQVGMFGYFTDTGLVQEDADNSPDAGACMDMLGEQDPNAAWLSLAHVICTEAGIPEGHMNDRLPILRDILEGLRGGTNDAHLSGEVKGGW